jgi:hypothetical protein
MPKSQPAHTTPASKTAVASKTTLGHCQCRKIEYAFTGKPLWTAHCHCEGCRRATSAAFATYVGVKLDQFTYLQGEPNAYEPSPGAQRYFCGSCGSPLAFIGTQWPGEVHLYAGALVDPAAIEPHGHAHTAEQLPWAEVHDDLPRFAKTGKGSQPVGKGPRSK